MDESINFVRCLTLGFCVFVVSAASCTAHQNLLEQEIILKADDKAKAACALAGVDRQKAPVCTEISRAK